MAFIPDAMGWLESHYREVPQKTVEFCGSLKGLRVLDVGCGEMLSDFGLLSAGVAHVTGLDIHAHPWDVIEAAAGTLTRFGVAPVAGYKSRLAYSAYDGENFPFPDRAFDFVFSWSAFEHIRNPRVVFAEMRRVVAPGGRVFIQVFPWFPCFHGSHLTDFISEPYFHLKQPKEWVRARLEEHASKHPESADLVLGHMWPEYCSLNRYSASRFFEELSDTGFALVRSHLITYDQDVSCAPPDVPLVDLMISGSLVLVAPK